MSPSTHPVHATPIAQAQQLRKGRESWGGGNAPHGGASGEGGAPIARIIDVLRRHLILILALTIAGSALGAVATKRVTPVYEAQATIWINGANAQQAGPIRAQELLPNSSWIALLRSFAIVDPVVSTLRLNVAPKLIADSALFRDFQTAPKVIPGAYTLRVDRAGRGYVLESATGSILEQGLRGDSVGRRLGFVWIPDSQQLTAGRVAKFSVMTQRTASIGLLGRLRASLPDGGQFLTIGLSGSDPQRTAQTVNALTQQFVTSATDLKKHNVVGFSKILGDQLAVAESELRDAEMQLEQFRVQTITLPSDKSPVAGGVQATRDPVFTNFFQQKEMIDEVRGERMALERMLREAQGGPLNTQEFLFMPTILNNTPQLRAAIEELSVRQAALRNEQQFLTDANPRIKQLSEAVRVLQFETIPRITQGVLATLRSREEELGSRVATQSQELRAIPARTIEEMRLLRRVTASENLYNSIKARHDEVSMSEAELTPDLTILDWAIAPTRPNSNSGPRLIMLCVVASLGLAIGLSLLLDRLDRRFRYPDQATNELGLDIAGTVPRMRLTRGGKVDIVTMSQTVESFRSLRLSLRYDFPGDVPVVLSVSSPSAGDGKSIVSSNLALAFATAGCRTLLMDGDVRCGTQHGTFGVTMTPGLIDYLREDADIDQVIKPGAAENLYIMPCGTRGPGAPELLVSERMNALVASMQKKFDVVIIDSPPFVAGMDAYALGAAAGSMLVVLRPNVTDRKLAAAKLDILDRLPIRILGTVLNGVPDSGEYRYYGNDYKYTDQPQRGPAGNLTTPRGLVLR